MAICDYYIANCDMSRGKQTGLGVRGSGGVAAGSLSERGPLTEIVAEFLGEFVRGPVDRAFPVTLVLLLLRLKKLSKGR